jgi:S-adenosylmethionine:tRNA ribosyltransferase-isomerase
LKPRINIDEYRYDLPDGRIAQYPLAERDLSKLLIYKGKRISHDIFRNIIHYLEPASLIVFNDSKVIHARIRIRKPTGSVIEIFCLNPAEPADYEKAFSSTGECTWECMVGNLKKWKTDVISQLITINDKKIELTIRKKTKIQGGYNITFSWNDTTITFGELIEHSGMVPLPPYIKRKPLEEDNQRYQTIYACHNGSVAAPTAGLHFTDDILEQFKQKNINTEKFTLHVGAGTFIPVKAGRIEDHLMHAEYFIVSRKTLETLIENSAPVIAVGTTSVRALESLYWLGINMKNNNSQPFYIQQWIPYESEENISAKKSLSLIIEYMIKHNLNEIKASTRLLIVPGYSFRYVNQLITNFHQPGSTLLMLVAAFIGSDWKRVYDYALQHDFRFLSYGDSSLLIPEKF